LRSMAGVTQSLNRVARDRVNHHLGARQQPPHAASAGRGTTQVSNYQSRRYQIANPMAGGRATQQIEIHPVPFLLEVLLETKTLTPLEYILFCAKAKSFGDIEDAIEGIEEWRKLGPRRQDSLIKALDAVKIGKPGKTTRRSSIYNTVRLNSSYAIAFWTASRPIEQVQKDGKAFLRIPRSKLPEGNAITKRAQRDGQFIAFGSKKDWMAFYGDPAKPANKATALTYYTDTAQLEMVRQVLDEMGGYTEEEKRRYLSMILNEQTVEDILEHNMHLIEPGMTLVKRQLETEVGRIDLFARDKNGVFTIIELKKGKTDDDVFGQLSRYLGWCKKTKARTQNVRGIIIAKQIGKKLWAAADGHETPVELMEYDLKMSLERARRTELLS
ncbi:MAG TPA: endonuclease NucS domain-containing protein, partial [Acetobacteraceae bacterium]|nr:endonuclease NucS domain-containing protein [Acetobacteraceae bacterium]